MDKQTIDRVMYLVKQYAFWEANCTPITVSDEAYIEARHQQNAIETRIRKLLGEQTANP